MYEFSDNSHSHFHYDRRLSPFSTVESRNDVTFKTKTEYIPVLLQRKVTVTDFLDLRRENLREGRGTKVLTVVFPSLFLVTCVYKYWVRISSVRN